MFLPHQPALHMFWECVRICVVAIHHHLGRPLGPARVQVATKQAMCISCPAPALGAVPESRATTTADLCDSDAWKPSYFKHPSTNGRVDDDYSTLSVLDEHVARCPSHTPASRQEREHYQSTRLVVKFVRTDNVTAVLGVVRQKQAPSLFLRKIQVRLTQQSVIWRAFPSQSLVFSLPSVSLRLVRLRRRHSP